MAYSSAIRVVMDDKLVRDLDELARANFCSKSAIVRQAIARAVAENRAQAKGEG